jgi:hypothetical protein
MSPEDYFHPNETANDYDRDQQNREINNLKSIDSGYGYLYRYKANSAGIKKRLKVDCYTSGDIGSHIRNAETGEYTKYKVGSKDEDNYFKIKICTGDLKTRNGNTTLFYDSTEQFESHLLEELDQDVKESWLEKYKLYLQSKQTNVAN